MPIDDLLIFQRIVVHANCRVVDIRQRVLAEQQRLAEQLAAS
jgi:hypothetical protein